MVKCSYCGCDSAAFKGVHVLQNDGVVSYYCGSKCRVNALTLKRDKRRLKWTAAYREEKEKLAVRKHEMAEKATKAKEAHTHKEHTAAHKGKEHAHKEHESHKPATHKK